jgi:hypothetical protein
LCNAVLVWNTVHMSRIIEQLRTAGVTSKCLVINPYKMS